jgi:hypothetical protein
VQVAVAVAELVEAQPVQAVAEPGALIMAQPIPEVAVEAL